MSDAVKTASRPARGIDIADRASVWAMTLFVAALLIIFLLLPLLGILMRSLETPDGLGLGNFIATFSTMRFWELVGDSILVSLTSTAIVVVVAYGYAYALQRAIIPGKWFLRTVILVPLFAPSLVQAQGLILLLGRNGILNRYLGFDLDIYGFWGVAIANALYAFPYAFLILSAALAVADARIYESAEALGAGPLRIFRDVTLPATRYGLAATLFIVFMLAITDFGNPMVIGGDFNVLATEVYNQVIGQAQFGLGAVIGVALLVPAMFAKLIEKRMTARQHALVTEQSRPLTPKPSARRDLFFSLYAYVVAGLVVSVVAIVVFASFVHLWPYNMSFTLRHYRFDVQNGTDPLWNSVFVAFATAIVGIIVTGLGAIVVHKFKTALTGPLSFLAILPAAVPGIVLGLGYILVFNDPHNPLNFLYGTFALIVILEVYYNHAHAFLISSTSLKQIGATFDEASTTLGGTSMTTLRKVTLPLIWPTLLGVGVFYFMRSMVSLSAVIFLVTPSTQLASVSVLQLSDRGAINQAAAFSVCIMGIVVLCLIVVRVLMRLAGVRDVNLIR